MTNETRYTISQLAELADVTPRTIRYYTAEGLLPRPEARGQYALYSQEHLLRLQLIARLKAAYLPLSEIKTRIEQLDVEQVRALLAGEQAQPEPAPITSAADYLAEVLAQQPAAPAYQRPAEHPESYTSAIQPGDTVQQRLGGHAPVQPSATPTYGFAAPAPDAAQPSLLRRLLRERRPAASVAASSSAEPYEHWRRIALAPGVELHLREPTTERIQARIDELIAWARSALDSE